MPHAYIFTERDTEMKKRIIAFLLCAAFLLSAAASCGSNLESIDPAPTKSGSAVADENKDAGVTAANEIKTDENKTTAEISGGETIEAAEEEIQNDIYAAPVEREFFKFTFFSHCEKYDPETDEMAAFLNEKFNMEIEFVGGDAQSIMLKMLSDDLPDRFNSSYGDPDYKLMIKEGYLKEIPDALLDRFPYLKEVVETGVASNSERGMFGTRYSLPNLNDPFDKQMAWPMPFFYRKDWAENLGIKHPPETLDEYYEMLRAFTFDDPNNTGKKDTHGICQWIFFSHMQPWCNGQEWMKNEDGIWMPGYVSELWIEGLLFYNRLYLEGIIDPEFAVNDGRQRRYWLEDKIGVISEIASTWFIMTTLDRYQQHHGEEDWSHSYAMIPPLTAPGNTLGNWMPNKQLYNSVFSSKMSDAKFYRLLEFFDYICSPEGRDFFIYGFYEKDWVIDENGKALNIRPIDPEIRMASPLRDVYPSSTIVFDVTHGLKHYTVPANANWSMGLDYEDEVREVQEALSKNLYPLNIELGDIVDRHMASFPVSPTDIEFKLNEAVTQPAGTAETFWRNYIKALYDISGLQNLIDKVNADMAALGL